MKLCYDCIIHTEAQALSVTNARIVYEIRSIVYGRNAEYLPKMADYRALVGMGMLYVAIFETK